MTRVLIVAAILTPAALILWLGHFAAGVTVCTLALLVIWWYGYCAVQADKARRRRYREVVWQRREGRP
jgi:membrane protein implicated in regulation of membrane protease activity